jgi:hypothetical protein
VSTEYLLPKKIGHAEFKLESIGTVIVSTIELPLMYQQANPRRKYETAIIWDQQHEADDGYHIDWVGFSLHVALSHHESWCDETKLAKLIHASVTAKLN